MSFPYDIFEFLIQPIRLQDQKTGFLRRYLQGPQEVAGETLDNIQALLELPDWERTPDQALRHLLWHVGFTRDLETVLQNLEPDDLRRLLNLAIEMWKWKGVQLGLEGAIRTLIGRDPLIFDWFHLRFEEAKTYLGEEWEGEDPFILGTPGDSERDEYYSIIFLEDTLETVNQTLLAEVARLNRPVGERFDIFMCLILELFDLNFSRWTKISGDGAMSIVDGALVTDFSSFQTFVKFNVSEALNWKSYMMKARIKLSLNTPLHSFYLVVYGDTDFSDCLYVQYDPANSRFKIGKRVGSSYTSLKILTGWHLAEDVEYVWTIVVDHRYFGQPQERVVLKFYIDDAFVGEHDVAIASVPTAGTVGYIKDPNVKSFIDWVRVQDLPITAIEVGP